MIWGYPHFREHPSIHIIHIYIYIYLCCFFMVSRWVIIICMSLPESSGLKFGGSRHTFPRKLTWNRNMLPLEKGKTSTTKQFFGSVRCQFSMSNFSMVFPFQPLSVQNVQVPAVRVGTYFPILKSSATFHLVMGPRRSSSERWISPSARSRTCRTNNSRGKTGTPHAWPAPEGAGSCYNKKMFGSFAKVSGFVCVISFLIYMIYVYSNYLETQGN